MYLEINDPVDYRTALYVRLSKEDENEGRSEGVTGQKSMLEEFVGQNRLKVYDTYIDATVIIGLNQQSLGVQGVAPV